MTATKARAELRKKADPKKAAFFPKFFKAGPGEYAEGDRFLGVTVPQVRKVASSCRDLPVKEVESLLRSPWNEERLLALLILVDQYRRSSDIQRRAIFRFYLRLKRHVNNWNLVDASAHLIVGTHLQDQDRKVIFRLARSKSLWDRRISMVGSLAWIRKDDFKDTLRLCQILMSDTEDLIHKACGWMLREVGKRDEKVLRQFLDAHAPQMPRTMLRYSIERLPEKTRKSYLLQK